MPVLREERSEGRAILTMDRPEARNALSAELRREIAAAFRRLTRSDVGVVVLRGAGPAFCAGLDLKEAERDGLAGAIAGEGSALDMAAAMAGFPGPIIAAVRGAAVAGGFELALACDIVIAADDAFFVDGHARVGVLPHWGLSQILPRVIGPYRAKDLAFTGRRVSAHEAAAWGIVSRVVPAAELDRTALAAADAIAAHPADIIRRYKRLIDRGLGLPLGEALALEQQEPLLPAVARDEAGEEDR